MPSNEDQRRRMPTRTTCCTLLWRAPHDAVDVLDDGANDVGRGAPRGTLRGARVLRQHDGRLALHVRAGSEATYRPSWASVASWARPGGHCTRVIDWFVFRTVLQSDRDDGDDEPPRPRGHWATADSDRVYVASIWQLGRE